MALRCALACSIAIFGLVAGWAGNLAGLIPVSAPPAIDAPAAGSQDSGAMEPACVPTSVERAVWAGSESTVEPASPTFPARPVPKGAWLLAEKDFVWHGLDLHARLLEFPNTLVAELQFRNPRSEAIWWRELDNPRLRKPDGYRVRWWNAEVGTMKLAGSRMGGSGGGHGPSSAETTRDQRQAWEFVPGAVFELRIEIGLPEGVDSARTSAACHGLVMRLELIAPEIEVPLSHRRKSAAIQFTWNSDEEARAETVPSMGW